jgi:CRP-like cAMP-binding protein
MPPAQNPKPRGENALLAALPDAERALIAPALERVTLEQGQTLQETDRPVSHIWFPHAGVLSTLSTMSDGAMVEVATVGREGMIGLPLVLRANQVAQTVFVQVPGYGDRLPAAAFAALRERLPMLESLLLRYTLAFLTQIAQGSACNRLHPIEARCARWLLMTHDRVDEDTFPLTQEFLGQMLGVTRPSVSVAAGMLQKAGLISYTRGSITVCDRPGLEEAACECYAVILGEFRRTLARPQ